MVIRIKLMGMLKDKTPADSRLTLDEGATITDALAALQIPVDSVQVFTVDGTLERDKRRTLSENNELTVLAPVGGG